MYFCQIKTAIKIRKRSNVKYHVIIKIKSELLLFVSNDIRIRILRIHMKNHSIFDNVNIKYTCF
jgi:hypothetical protein